jgi:hypothetical protein
MEEKTLNVVTIDLKTYTDLIIENTNLKALVAGCHRKIKEDVREEIYRSTIDSLKTTAECWEWLSKPNDKLLNKFSTGGNWAWENVAHKNYDIMSVGQIKELAASEIKKSISERLGYLKEKEEEESSGTASE